MGVARNRSGRRSYGTILFAVVVTACSLAACGGRVDSESPEVNHGAFGPFAEREVGQPCAFGDQCASWVCSADLARSACGQCMNVAKLGAACGGLNGCHPGAACRDGHCESTKKLEGAECALGPKREDIGECDLEFFCADGSRNKVLTGRCEKRFSHGERCDVANKPCPWTETCSRGICGKRSKPGSVGEACQSSGIGADCEDGLFCDEEDRTCRPSVLPPGARCGLTEAGFTNGECAAGTVCGNVEYPNGGGPRGSYTCVSLPAEGAPCISSACGAGAYCRNLPQTGAAGPVNRCERFARAGENCNRDNYQRVQCERGLECRAGRCEMACR